MKYWKNFYLDEAEDRLRKNLEPLGETVTFWVYVDANHAGNLSNRRSQSGILIYVNNELINFYSKRQNAVESLGFGSDFVALRIATEMVESLSYNLRTFVVNL